MNPRHTTEFTVHLHHLDPGGPARPGLRFDCFQVAASEQSATRGRSILELMQRGPTWVVPRHRLKVRRYPGWQERNRGTTWQSPHWQRICPS